MYMPPPSCILSRTQSSPPFSVDVIAFKPLNTYRAMALNVTRIWIELAVWAAMVSTAQFSLSGSRLMPSPGTVCMKKLSEVPEPIQA